MIIRPTYPGILRPTFALEAAPGGLPWESRAAPERTLIQQFGANLLAYYSTTFDGTITSIADASSNARTLSVSGTASARPAGLPRNGAENGRPVIGLNSGLSQYAQDTAGDAAAFWGRMHLAACGFVAEIQGLDASAEGQDFGTFNGSSNGNTFSLSRSSTQLLIYWTSTTGGGTVHILASTTANAIRPSDTFRITALHQSDKSWSITIQRRKRIASESTPSPIVLTGSYSSTVAAGNAPAGITFGNYTGLAGTFKSAKIDTLVCFTIDATTPNVVAQLEAMLDGYTEVPFVSYAATGALLRASDFDADNVHWNDTGHARAAAAGITAEQAIASALGWSGSKNIAVIGDSRFTGTGASSLATAFRRKLADGPFTGFTHLGYGPIDDGGGDAASKQHFARSGYITRTVAAQLGHSQRSPHSVSIDVHINAATGTHRAADLWHICIGINQMNASLTVNNTWDYGNELLLMCEYIIAQRALFDGGVPAFILYTEPITTTTTTGLLQRLIRAYNREIHYVAQRLRQYTTCYVVQLNDETDNA